MIENVSFSEMIISYYRCIKLCPIFFLQPRFDRKMDFSSISVFIAFVSLKYAAFDLSMSDCFHQNDAAKYAETENRTASFIDTQPHSFYKFITSVELY